MSVTFIIAGTFQEYREWCIKNSPPRLDALYVDSVNRLRGYNKPSGKFIGAWYRRDDILIIMNQLIVAGSIDKSKYLEILKTRDRLLDVSSRMFHRGCSIADVSSGGIRKASSRARVMGDGFTRSYAGFRLVARVFAEF